MNATKQGPPVDSDLIVDDLPYSNEGLFLTLIKIFGNPNGWEMIRATLHCYNARIRRENRKENKKDPVLTRFNKKTQHCFVLELAGFHAVMHAVEAIAITRGDKEGHHRRATETGFFKALKGLSKWELEKDEETLALMFASNAYITNHLKPLGVNEPEDNLVLFSTRTESDYQQLQEWMMDWANFLLKRIRHEEQYSSAKKPM